MAETRAEGRALRKLLQLRKVVSAEELSPNQKVEESSSSDKLTDNQISFIDLMSRDDERGMNIDVAELISQVIGITDLDRLSHADGLELTNQLSKYQQSKDSIPDTLVGYKATWKNEVQK
jgi:hypothetical protein